MSPILVMLLRIETLARPLLNSNARAAMLVTGRALVVLGMVTAPPEPVYLVMVIVPLLVVKVNWAAVFIVLISWAVMTAAPPP